MRSLKSRFSLIALIILPAMAIYFFILSIAINRGEFFGFDSQMAAELYEVMFKDRGMYFQQGRAFDYIDSWLNILLMVNTVFIVCDYYRYNLRVNLEGAVKERYKFVLADITALGIMSFIFSFLNLITLFSGLLLGESNILLLDHPLRALMMCTANALNIFCSVVEAYAIAQLFRNKLISIIVLLVEQLFSSLADSCLMDILKITSDDPERLYNSVAHSTWILSQMASGSEPIDSFLLRIAIISITAKILIASVLSIVFFMWRREK